MESADEIIAAMVEVIERLRGISEATHQNTPRRHQVWLGLWQRGYGLTDIAQASGHARERVRMVLRAMNGGCMPERAPKGDA
jgi:DNA-binding phage protein